MNCKVENRTIDPADIVIMLRAVIEILKASIVKEIDLLEMAEPI